MNRLLLPTWSGWPWVELSAKFLDIFAQYSEHTPITTNYTFPSTVEISRDFVDSSTVGVDHVRDLGRRHAVRGERRQENVLNEVILKGIEKIL